MTQQQFTIIVDNKTPFTVWAPSEHEARVKTILALIAQNITFTGIEVKQNDTALSYS